VKDYIVGDKSEYYSTVKAAGIFSSGRLEPGQQMTSPDTTDQIVEQNENEYLSQINAVGVVSDPLPPQGTWLEAGIIYAWEGQNVIVRQEHLRTEHDPDTVPALFTVYRENYDGMLWIANENILIGDERTHEEIKYSGIQAHTTVAGQTPDLTPALWKLYREDWAAWVQPVGSHDVYRLDDKVTHNAVRWISTNDANSWEPGVFGWVEE
jgi:hypothetical protein